MFSPGDRSELRDHLIAVARADLRIQAVAVVGSAALEREDSWSDIDLALRLRPGLTPSEVAADWTARMYADHGAVDDLDVWSGSTLFRVFLLSTSLQVDLSFWPAETFAATGPAFRLVFGAANEPRSPDPPAPGPLIATGWLYAVHARSSIARGRALQALTMVDGLREQVVSLACLRHGTAPHQGRGVDDLPVEVRRRLGDTVVRGLEPAELTRACGAAVGALLSEADHTDPALARRLELPARILVESLPSSPPVNRRDPVTSDDMTIGVQQLMLEVERVRDSFHTAVFVHRDLEAALAETSEDCILSNLPMATGAHGGSDLRHHLADEVLAHVPADLTFRRLSRTTDRWRVVEETTVAFTHDRELPWLLPGLAPTHRSVEVLAISVVTVRRSQITTHRTLWDHSGLMAQLGLAALPPPSHPE